ncbi:MAG: cyclic nucleotide-binding domain-containing protein [Opitutae bacterium]|jgi:signal-transduction protein with cAMP-binding, CBS, and nucleotidyltransferase domain|nr:cyclic nucleotide-binding domain-containing protein [Opitutae bacterium]
MNESYNPLSNLSEVRGILSRISFLGGLEGGAFESMMRYFEHAVFKAGECIICAGESPTHIYIIQSGNMELRIGDGRTNMRKREFIVGIILVKLRCCR